MNKEKMQLLGNRVLVKIINEDIKTYGGLYIPKQNDFLPFLKAKVVLLGKSSYGDWWLNVGDIVNLDKPQIAVSEYTPYEYNGEECLIVNENDINFVY